jgi:uncharacterized protein (TIGR03382 family)
MRFILLLLLSLAGSALAAERVLCTDSLQPAEPAFFQGGFAVADEAAVRFTAPDDASLVKVVMLWGGGDFIGEGFTETLHVYDANGTDVFEFPGFPGARLYTGDAPLIASDTEATEIAVSPSLEVAGSSFWVSIAFRHAGFPGVARDDSYDSTSAVYASSDGGTGWYENDVLRVGGDWIIRAVVETDEPIDDTGCRFDGSVAIGEGEGEGEVGEGEGEPSEGEGEPGEGEGEAQLFVTSITPSTWLSGEVVEIAILGSGFDETTTFRVGPSAIADVVVAGTEAIRGTVPALAVGTYDVIAQTGAAVFVLPSAVLVVPVDVVDEAPIDGGCGCSTKASTPSLWLVVAFVVVRRRRPVAG